MLRKLLIPLKMIVVTFIYDILYVLAAYFSDNIASLVGTDSGTIAVVWFLSIILFGWFIKKIIFTDSSGSSVSIFGSWDTMAMFFAIKWGIKAIVYFLLGLVGLLVCNVLSIYTIIFKCVKKEAF